MCVEPKELHGTAYVSNELDKSSLVTASVATIANWWNAFTTLPFLVFMFDSMGIITWPINAATNGAQTLIHQGCDSIKYLALDYFQKELRVQELINTIQYVQEYLQHSHVNSSLVPRQIGYLDELLTSSINLGDRLNKAIQKKYNYIIGSH